MNNIQDLINKYSAGTSLAPGSSMPSAAAGGTDLASRLRQFATKKSPQQPGAMNNDQTNVPVASGGFNQHVPTQDRSEILRAMMQRSRQSNGGGNGA